MIVVGKRTTLPKWAETVDCTLDTIYNHYRGLPGFPQAKVPSSGTRAAEYDEEELNSFYQAHVDAGRAPQFPMPDEPERFLSLGAIASVLGVPARRVTRERRKLDKSLEDGVDRYAEGSRWYYRTRCVVDHLNNRTGSRAGRSPADDGTFPIPVYVRLAAGPGGPALHYFYLTTRNGMKFAAAIPHPVIEHPDLHPFRWSDRAGGEALPSPQAEHDYLADATSIGHIDRKHRLHITAKLQILDRTIEPTPIDE
ncbi:hypothetical protein ACWDUL_20870 [Nocardia niigatensis]